jgi:hypothetical protein
MALPVLAPKMSGVSVERSERNAARIDDSSGIDTGILRFMRFIVTDHAADRFILRIDRSHTISTAKTVLSKALHSSSVLRERTHSGQEIRAVDDPPCLLVCKKDPGNVVVVVTVLERDVQIDDDVEELVEAFKRQQQTKIENAAMSACEAKTSPLRVAMSTDVFYECRDTLREFIRDVLQDELDRRIDRFVAERDKESKLREEIEKMRENKRAKSVRDAEMQKAIAEAARAKVAKIESMAARDNANFQELCQTVVPKLYALSFRSSEATDILTRALEIRPSLSKYLTKESD